MTTKTGADRYFEKQQTDPAYRAAYEKAAAAINAIDLLVRSLDERRQERGLSKAALARRAGVPAEAGRRLFSMRSPNPTASTLMALANALEVDLIAAPRRTSAVPRKFSSRRATAAV